jgi:hypothetical protein
VPITFHVLDLTSVGFQTRISSRFDPDWFHVKRK